MIDKLSRFLGNFKIRYQKGNYYKAFCPSHKDTNPSLSITVEGDRILVHCHAGCKTEEVLAAVGLTKKDLYLSPNGTHAKKEVRAYSYTNEKGEELYQRVRYEPKDFAYRRKTANDYIYNMQGVERVLYNLPKVVEAKQSGELIFFVEGEKDVETLRLLGLTATTTGDANAKWIKDNASVLAPLYGANVVVLCDNDKPGRDYAHAVCDALSGKAKTLKFIDLATVVDGFPEKADVTDWIERFSGTKEKLLAIAARAPLYSTVETQEYIVRDGHFYHVTDKKETRISNFVATIAVEYKLDDRTVLQLQGQVNGEQLPALKVDASKFYKPKEWIAAWDSRLMITPRYSDHVCNAIVAHSNPVKHTIVTHTGFVHYNDQIIYCTNQSIISRSPLQNICVELDDEISKYHIPVPNAAVLTQARTTSLELLHVAQSTVSMPLWSAMYLAVLKEFLKPNFALWLYGKTGSFKTTLASLFLNHFGDFTHNDLLTWNATPNALERYLSAVKNAPIIIDDYAPMIDNYTAAKVEQTIVRVVRDVGNNSGRARMKYDTTLARVYRPNAFVIATGELLPDGESILARLMVVGVKRSDVDVQKLTQLQAKRQLLAACMYDFITYVIDHYNEIDKLCKALFERYRQELQRPDRHARLTEAIANMLVATTVAAQFFTYRDAMSKENAAALVEAAKEAMLLNAAAHDIEQQRENPVVLFLETLESLVAANKAALQTHNSVIGAGDLIGMMDGEKICLNPKESIRAVVKACRDANKRFPVKETALLRMMDEQGILIRDSKHFTTKVQRNGIRQRMIVLRRDAISDIAFGDVQLAKAEPF